MNVLDPVSHTTVRLTECEIGRRTDRHAVVRPFGKDHWFKVYLPTGQTERLPADPDPIHESGTPEPEISDTASSDLPTTFCKALFVEGTILPTGFPLIEVTPHDGEIQPPSPSCLFTQARGTLFQESASRRQGLMIDLSRLSPASLDATVYRLKSLGYDCLGLMIGETRKDRADYIRKVFGNRVKLVAVEDARPAALSLLGSRLSNPKGLGFWSKRKAESIKRSPTASAFIPEAPRKRYRPVKRVKALGESIEDENPHDAAPGWKLPEKSDWKSRSYGCVITDGRGRLLLREPMNHFDGYVWTFPKGKMDREDEAPVQVARREAREETGQTGNITGYVPGAFEGGSGTTYYYLMHATRSDPNAMDDETYRTRWVTPEEASLLIGLTHNTKGRERDLKVLQAAAKALGIAYTHVAPPPPPPPAPTSVVSKGKALFSKLGNAFAPKKAVDLSGPVGSGPTKPKLNTNPWAPKPYKPKESTMEKVFEDGGPESPGAAHKLANFITGHPQLSKQYVLQVVRPVALYKARKMYNRAKAPLLARHLVVAGGRTLARAQKMPGEWHQHFSQKTRDAAGVLLRNKAEKDAASRKFDSVLPRKYQAGFKGYNEGESETNGDAEGTDDSIAAHYVFDETN